MQKTAIQELAPYIDSYLPQMKTAKKYSDKTNQSIADASGVPLSNIAKLFSGHLAEPKLFNFIAICKTLGLSVDRLFGLSPSLPTDVSVLREENADLRHRVRELETELEHKRQMDEERKKASRARVGLTYSLIGMSLVLAAFIIYYLDYDYRLPNAGLVVQWEHSFLSVILTVVVVAVICIGAALLIQHIIAKRKRK